MIDLLVVNYNTRLKLERLARTLWESTKSPNDRIWKLYVTDNDSKDDSREWIENNKHFFDGIWLKDNLGYAKSINHMAANTYGDIFAACNADIWFTEDDIVKIGEVFATNPNIAILGPKQRDENGYITHAGVFGSLTRVSPHRGWKQHDPADLLYKDHSEALTVSGSAYFMRRNVAEYLRACPIFEREEPTAEYVFPEYPHFFEETMVSWHLHGHRFDDKIPAKELWYLGSISIGHSWHASSVVGSQNHNFIIGQQRFKKFCAAHRIPCNV